MFGKSRLMLVVMVWLLSGALWWEGWGRPGAARSSLGEPRRARRALDQLWASPGSQNTSTMTLFLGRLVVMVGLLSGALWWEGWGPPGAASSSPEQPRRVQESQESSGAPLGEPRVTQNPSTMTLFLGRLVCRFSLANLACGARGYPKSSKSAPLGRPEAGTRPRYAFSSFFRVSEPILRI